VIFGFNTDVKVGDVVYHVQSEARQKEQVLETQVFVKGQCIGKCAASYAQDPVPPDHSSEQTQDMLKAQHRRVVEWVRSGTLEKELDLLGSEAEERHAPESAAKAADRTAAISGQSKAPGSGALAWATVVAFPEGPSSGALAIECRNANSVLNDGKVVLRLQVTRQERPVEGVEVTLRLVWGDDHAVYSYANTAEDGTVEIAIAVNVDTARRGKALVQATFQEASATRRFHFRPPD
jgi:hypothetical protein